LPGLCIFVAALLLMLLLYAAVATEVPYPGIEDKCWIRAIQQYLGSKT